MSHAWGRLCFVDGSMQQHMLNALIVLTLPPHPPTTSPPTPIATPTPTPTPLTPTSMTTTTTMTTTASKRQVHFESKVRPYEG